MGKAGFTDAAVGLSIRNLKRMGFIEVALDSDYNGNEYSACKLTPKGENWVLDNQDKIELRKVSQPDDEIFIPF